jgi:amino acid adenylation domain-containing protein
MVDELATAGLAARFGARPVQRCSDRDLDADLLLQRSGRVTDQLLACGAGRGSVVVVKGRRDSWLLPVLLGVMGAGAAYAVVPFNSPDDVECRLLDTLEPAASITWRVDLPAAAVHRPAVPVDEDGPVVTALRDGAVPAIGPRHELDPAYMCATSGTSGVPKCVMVPHRAATAFLAASSAVVALAADDVVAARSSAAFDLSVWELFAPLLAGATTVLIPEDVAADPSRLHARLVESGATVLSTTPSAAYQLGAHDDVAGGGLALRRLLVGGEASDGARLADVLAAPSFARCRLDNWYGPTETTVSCTGGRLDGEELARTDVTIGPAMPGTTTILDARGGGESGELLVGGPQLALGYLGAPRATAAAFVPDPDGDGQRVYRTGDLVEVDDRGWFTHRGRIDSQVQLRGYRLELSEVERAIAADSRIRWSHAAVAGTDTDVLVAWFATRDDQPVDRPALWAELYNRLPRHAVPAALVHVTEVPVSEGEKLEARRLPEPAATDFLAGEPADAPPRTDTEIRMHGLWQRLLDMDGIGIDHHFFALGGHSLLAARLLNGITREFGVRLALREIMDRLTIRELAARVDDHDRSRSTPREDASTTGVTG